MKRLSGLLSIKKNFGNAIAVAAFLTMAISLHPESAQARNQCSVINPCPRLSGSPNAGEFRLDFDIDFSDLNSSTGFFPDVIQNAKYTACINGAGLSSGCPTFSLFFEPSYLISSLLPSTDSKFPGGTSYETIVNDRNSNFLKFTLFLPLEDSANDPLHSLVDLNQFLNVKKLVLLSSSSLNNPLPPSSGGAQTIPLVSAPEQPTNVPENPTSVLLGAGIMGAILVLKRLGRSKAT